MAVATSTLLETETRRLKQVRWSAALSALVIGLNLTVMNVAVADLRESFPNAKFTTIGWVVTAYTIVFGAVMVPAGRLADKLGRRSVFMTGIGAFALGSLIAGVAPSLWLLIAGRAVQGVGAACMTPSSLALLIDARVLAQLGHAYPYGPDGNGGPPLLDELRWGAHAGDGGTLTQAEPLFPRLDVEVAES